MQFIIGGGASTLQRGISKIITRGVNLDKSDFSNQDFHGISFQQSIVRDSNFENTNLQSASFFEFVNSILLLNYKFLLSLIYYTILQCNFRWFQL